MIDGIINVYKEQGYTSFDVVAKLRGILKQKKIGHTGTLDPMAEGVLMVCLGKATKLVDMLTSGTKEYKAVMQLGITTDTEDITGRILSENELGDSATDYDITDTVMSFVGKYDQIPPMYSAIKKDGKKLYEYARQGIAVERKARPVEIYSIADIEISMPYISFDVHCSKGTYIRSLCRDIGDKLGCGAALSALTRSEVHGFKLADSLKLDEIERLKASGELMEHILPVDALLTEYESFRIKDEYKKYLLNGNKLYAGQLEKIRQEYEGSNSTDGNNIIRIYSDCEFLALYQYEKSDNIYKPYKMFLG